jgi:hypothetical protein
VNDQALAFTGGDEDAARLLRDNLAVLHERLSGDPAAADLRRDVGAVLAGRMELRELVDVPAFRDLTQDGMRRAQEAWAGLTREQRAAAVRAGAERSR